MPFVVHLVHRWIADSVRSLCQLMCSECVAPSNIWEDPLVSNVLHRLGFALHVPLRLLSVFRFFNVLFLRPRLRAMSNPAATLRFPIVLVLLSLQISECFTLFPPTIPRDTIIEAALGFGKKKFRKSPFLRPVSAGHMYLYTEFVGLRLRAPARI